jgi:ankyrin repeat protein
MVRTPVIAFFLSFLIPLPPWIIITTLLENAYQGKIAIIQTLLDRGMDVNAKNNYGIKTLIIALICSRIAMYRVDATGQSEYSKI